MFGCVGVADWASAALDAFAAATGLTGEDLDTRIGDLLCDLRHLCDVHQVSFPACLSRADAHYRAEVDDCNDDPAPATVASATVDGSLTAVAIEYRDLLSSCGMDNVDRLIADACVDPFWDDRTNLLSLLAERPEDLSLVLSNDDAHQSYVVVRYR